MFYFCQMPQLFLIRLIRVIRGCKFLAFQQFIPEPFHIAHADSESRPTTTRSLALFKSTKIRFFRCIRVLFRPNNSTTQFTLTSHFFSSAPLREITSFICVLPTAPTYCDSFNSSHSWFEYSLIPTSEPFHIAHAD